MQERSSHISISESGFHAGTPVAASWGAQLSRKHRKGNVASGRGIGGKSPKSGRDQEDGRHAHRGSGFKVEDRCGEVAAKSGDLGN